MRLWSPHRQIPQELKKQLIVAKEGKAKFVTVETGVRQASAIRF